MASCQSSAFYWYFYLCPLALSTHEFLLPLFPWWGNHKASFNNRKYGKCSALAKEVWQIKDKGGIYNINWGVIRHAAAYNPVSKRCNLCLLEKLYIAENTGESLLNQRNELISKCRHKNKYALIYHNLTQSEMSN